MSLAKAVLRIRHEKQLTQREVGSRAHLATSYISRIENGRIQPTMVTLGRLAEALGVAAADIFKLAEAPQSSPHHVCPASSSGTCIGELLRSHKGKTPDAMDGKLTYGPGELRLLRMADYVILHGSREVQSALNVVLESLVNHASHNGTGTSDVSGNGRG